MIKHWNYLWCGLFVLVSACSESDYSDLEEFVNKSGEGLRGKIDPLPEIKSVGQFNYEAFNVPDPFSARKNNPSKNQDMLQPDLKRRKEVLESFPLENLAMVGTLQRNKQIYALIRAPDKTIYRVKAGNYLGQNFGLITGITEAEVKLKEIIQDSANDWTERVSTLILQAVEQK